MAGFQLQSCNFEETEARARKMDDAALEYTIQDCYEAAKCADSIDAMGLPNNSGKYWDEYHTFVRERARRQSKKPRSVHARYSGYIDVSQDRFLDRE